MAGTESAATHLGGMQSSGIVRVLEELPELTYALSRPQAAEARRVPVRAISLNAGPWRTMTPDDPGNVGLIVLDGLLARSASLQGGSAFTELLGGGDLLRPWVGASPGLSSVSAAAEWDVLYPTRLAVLDRRFALAVGAWPEVIGAILDRAVERSRSLVFQLAVCHLKRVDARLLAALWHLADRWGRVTRDGVVVPLPLTHKLLASMVGAHRPSVTTALGSLRDRGVVTRRADGTWLLTGDPPHELADPRAEAVQPRRAD